MCAKPQGNNGIRAISMKNPPRYEKFPPCFSTSEILNNENPVLNYEKSPPCCPTSENKGGFFIEIALMFTMSIGLSHRSLLRLLPPDQKLIRSISMKNPPPLFSDVGQQGGGIFHNLTQGFHYSGSEMLKNKGDLHNGENFS